MTPLSSQCTPHLDRCPETSSTHYHSKGGKFSLVHAALRGPLHSNVDGVGDGMTMTELLDGTELDGTELDEELGVELTEE